MLNLVDRICINIKNYKTFYKCECKNNTVNIYRINFTTIPFSHYYLFWKSKLFLKNSYIYKTISYKPHIFYNVLKLEIMVVNEMQEPCLVNRGAEFRNPNRKLIVPMQPIRSLGCIYFVLEQIGIWCLWVFYHGDLHKTLIYVI